MEKFQNKYRIASSRLQDWDYRSSGAYFITICTQNREHYFGKITDGAMQLTNIGVIADILWHQIPHHHQNVELGEFVVMPNHIHGILMITAAETLHATSPQIDDEQTLNNVETLQATSLHATSLPKNSISQNPIPPINEQMSKISPKSNSVSVMVRSYKSAVTKHAHRLGFEFQWQARFHDHIIRDDQSFKNISNYIINNPANWQEDQFFKSEQLK